MRWSVAVVAIGLAALSGASPAAAQYFGQNKVTYRSFDFKVLATDHFDVYYYPEEEASVKLAARMAERWYVRLSKVLGHELSSRQPLILYAAHPHFQQTNVVGGEIGEGTGGVTESAKRRVVMPFAGGLAETDHVLGHEIVHAFQYDIANVSAGNTGSRFEALPLWFVEGMAEYLSLGPVDAHTAMWVRDAAARGQMPTLEKLDDPNFFPYRYGHAFWAYVGGRWGDSAVAEVFRSAVRTGFIADAVQNILGLDSKQFSAAWHEDTRRTYATFIETAQAPSQFGRPLANREISNSTMNLAPSLSPDGRRLVSLSERSMFAIEMYVTDVATGKVIRKLVKTAGDPHFESLQFIDSAGDWSPDGTRFVFAALSVGKPVLSIVDVDTGRRVADHDLPDLDQVFNPAWSPDGRTIAFTAMKGGVLDLYTFDLERQQTTRLTDDPFADYDPEWAPNGREIAWVTDRFSANLDDLQFGGYRIGLMDVSTKAARPLAGFPDGRNTNPEFAADGRSLFFIGTPDGVPNVYRMDLASGSIVALSNVVSGVSGITSLTPALSVASAGDNMAFTVFEHDTYNIYALEGVTQIPGRPVPGAERNGALLAPMNRAAGTVFAYLGSPASGLPPAQEVAPEDYKAKLGLDLITQPTASVGVDRWGAYGAGSLAMLWSDMLGNHQLGTYFQVTSRFSELGAGATYINKSHRWNWGITGERMPYVYGQWIETLADWNDDGLPDSIAQGELRYTQINQGASAMLQYPFNRAQRLEVTGGLRQIRYKYQFQADYYSLTSGSYLGDRTVDFEAPETLNLGEVGTALVYDSAITGATSPILGQRYRLEYMQSAGSLRYSGILADYRKYVMPARPFTLAFRGMHYGRYGRDGEDFRMGGVSIGYPGLVRGYEYLDNRDCPTSPCQLANRVYGTRMAVANAELRFPLFGIFSRRSYYGPLPIEGIVFGDAGVAWTSDSQPRWLGGTHDAVRSVGTGIRFNLLGFLIGEIDFVKPLDRPTQGWMWQFSFVPGF